MSKSGLHDNLLTGIPAIQKDTKEMDIREGKVLEETDWRGVF